MKTLLTDKLKEFSIQNITLFDFSYWPALQISGPDSIDFINRLTTISLKKTSAAQSPLNEGFLLESNGKIKHFFLCQWIAPDSIVLRTWPEAIHSLKESFERLHFLEKLTLTICGDLSGENAGPLFRLLSAGPTEAPKTIPWQTNTELTTLLESHLEAYQLYSSKNPHPVLDGWLIPMPSAESKFRSYAASESTWQTLRIANGIPDVNEWSQSCIPLEIRGLRGIHQSKGCYPGQEVIERLLTQGQPPKQLVLIKSLSNKAQEILKPGQTLFSFVTSDITSGGANSEDAKEAAVITSVSPTGDALGLLKKSFFQLDSSLCSQKSSSHSCTHRWYALDPFTPI